MTRKSALMFLGGDANDIPSSMADDFDFVVAVDSGLRLAQKLGYRVDLLVGDLDSLSEPEKEAAQANGIEIIEFAPAKDFTDFELALDLVLEREATDLTVVAFNGGRVDHAVGNIASLAHPKLARLQRTVLFDSGTMHMIGSEPVTWHGNIGEIVSLLPIGGEVTGVQTNGLLFPLAGATLSPYSAFALSNEMVSETASVRVTTGSLLVVHLSEFGPLHQIVEIQP